jgi:hypothetical protein
MLTVNRRTLSLTSFAALLAAIIWGHYSRRTEWSFQLAELEKTLEQYRASGYLASPDGIDPSGPPYEFSLEPLKGVGELYLWNCLQLVNRISGKHLTRIVFNGPISDDAVNIFLIQRDPHGAFASIRNNCAYVGHSKNLILCDADFLHELQDEKWRHTLRRQNQKELDDLSARIAKNHGDSDSTSQTDWASVLGYWNQIDNRQLIIWVLAHEMGHLARDDSRRHFIFPSESRDLLIQAFDSRYSQIEVQADHFALEALGDDPLLIQPLRTALETAVNRFGSALLIREDQSTDIWSTDEKIVVKRTSDTHPPLFLRALNMLTELNKQHHLSDDDASRLDSLRTRVVVAN